MKGLARALAIPRRASCSSSSTIITVISITGRTLIWAGLRPVPGDFETGRGGRRLRGLSRSCPVPDQSRPRHGRHLHLLSARPGQPPHRHRRGSADDGGDHPHLRGGFGSGCRTRFATARQPFILQFPVWWAFAACMAAAVIGVVVFVLHGWRTGSPNCGVKPSASEPGEGGGSS